MENASKALIMAGAILVAILIISLGILVFNNFGSKAKEMTNMDEQEISAFNSKITPYLGNSISGSQVNALIQYVISNNLSCVKSGQTHKAIKITYPTNTAGIYYSGTSVTYGNNIKRVETGASKFYKVKASGYSDDGLINYIEVNE